MDRSQTPGLLDGEIDTKPSADPFKESEDPDDLQERRDELREWEDVFRDARDNAMRDHDYYDGKQWLEEDAVKVRARGQPVTVFNRIAPKINYVLGTEIETRKKPRAHPRTVDDEADADGITDALRYTTDEADFEGEFTDMAESVLKEGTGGMVVRLDTDDVSPDSEIVNEAVPYDRLFHDPRARKKSGRDSKYCGVVSWMTDAEVLSIWPDAEDVVDKSRGMGIISEEGSESRYRWYNKNTKEFQVIEHYYVAYSKRTKLMEWHECWWVAGGYLEPAREVKYRDDSHKDPEKCRTWCPLVFTSPYIYGGNSETAERYGPVRNMRGPQDEINFRRSKAIHQLHANQIWYETGALANPEEARREMMRPDGMIELSKGRLKDGIQIKDNLELAAAQVEMLQEAKAEIDQIGPRPMPLQDSGGSKMSGRLYIAQQETGSMEMRPVFDCLRRAAIEIFKRHYWLVRMTWTEEKWFIVEDHDSDDGHRLVGLNIVMTRGERFQNAIEDGVELKKAARTAFGFNAKRLIRAANQTVQMQLQRTIQAAQQAGQQPPPPQPAQLQEMVVQVLMSLPEAREAVIANNVGRVHTNIIIDTSPNSVLAQHEQFLELVGMAKDGLLPLQDPRILIAMLELSSMPRKRKIINMLKAPPDPQQQQAQQAAQQAQQMEMMKKIELLGAQVANLMAQAKKSEAQAALAVSKTQTEPTVGTLREAQAQKALADAEEAVHSGHQKHTTALKTAGEAGQASVDTGD